MIEYMRIPSFLGVLFIVSITASCLSFELREPEPPVAHSFPNTGNLTESGRLDSIIEYSWLRREPLPQANILMDGQLLRVRRLQNIILLSNRRKLRHQDGAVNIFLPPSRQTFAWTGSITMNGNTVNADIEFDVYANNDGRNKRFILREASFLDVRFQFDDPFEFYIVNNARFPFLLGNVFLSSEKYRVYAVIDETPHLSMVIPRRIFFYPMQIFQFLDQNDKVIAELEGNEYFIYNVTAEEEITRIKYAIALLVIFRHSASILNNLDSWEFPFFYRYVYREWLDEVSIKTRVEGVIKLR